MPVGYGAAAAGVASMMARYSAEPSPSLRTVRTIVATLVLANVV